MSKFFIYISTVLALINFAYAEYNQDLSKGVLYLAKVAQCDKEKIQNWTCSACKMFPQMQNVTVFFDEKMDAQGYTSYDPKSNVLAVGFRGSHSTTNWVYNFDFIKTHYPNCEDCRVHSGFYKTYLSISQNVLQSVQQLYTAYPNSRIFVTGHSLGAAMSTLAAADIVNQIAPINEYFNYGSPRVGNRKWAEYFDSLISQRYRVVHYRDMVPHLPMIELGFWHVSQEVWYDDQNSTSYIVCNESGEDFKCSDSILPILWKPKDHDVYMNISCGC